MSNVGHSINWNNASIVYKSNGSFKRKVVEATVIQNVANINLSRCQRSPDIITSVVVGKCSPVSCDLTRPTQSAQEQVT